MIVVIEIPTDKIPEYTAWNVDNHDCYMIGTGDTIEEAKADFLNSVEEMKEICADGIMDKEVREYLEEEICFYLALQRDS